MAQITIRNARVGRIIQDKGFEAVESYQTRAGETKETRYTVWTDSPADIPGENVIVNVTGNVSARAEQFTNERNEEIRFARIHVNQPKISLQDTPAVQPAPDNWTQGFNSEAPF